MRLIKALAPYRNLALSVVVLSLIVLATRSGSAQSPEERKFVDKTPKGMPVKIEAVRNLNKAEDEWFRDLEIEVRNVSDKPIYNIVLVLDFPDIPAPPPTPRADGITPSGSVTGIPLKFGNSRLRDLKEIATPEDISLKPEETYVFKVPKQYVRGLAHMKRIMGLTPETMKKIELHVNTVSFGDGTGFIGPRKKDYRRDYAVERRVNNL